MFCHAEMQFPRFSDNRMQQTPISDAPGGCDDALAATGRPGESIMEVIMRKLAAIGFLSAAAALGLFCSTVAHGTGGEHRALIAQMR